MGGQAMLDGQHSNLSGHHRGCAFINGRVGAGGDAGAELGR